MDLFYLLSYESVLPDSFTDIAAQPFVICRSGDMQYPATWFNRIGICLCAVFYGTVEV